MRRNTNKKGFSLLEMLAVIAIIAILISIVVPYVSTETTKSAAASNAANLRTTVAQLAVKRASNEDQFEAAYQRNLKRAGNVIRDVASPLLSWLGWKNFNNWATRNLYDCTAINGELFWLDNNKVFLSGVAAAKKMVVKDSAGGQLIIPEGAPMHVYISDDAVVATYRAASGEELGIDDFADIAEDGNYDGGVTEGGSGSDGFWGGVEDWWDSMTCPNHYPDPSAGCYCLTCNVQEHVRSSRDYHTCECGTSFGNQCSDGRDADYVCDYLDCNEIVHPRNHVEQAGSIDCAVPGCTAKQDLCGCTNYAATSRCDTSCKNCDGHSEHSGACTYNKGWK